MVTRRGLFAGIFGAILGFLGISAVIDRREADEPIPGTGPTGGHSSPGHVLRVRAGEITEFVEGRPYRSIEWELDGTLRWEPGTTLTING